MYTDGGHILVVDDEEVIRELMNEILSEEGFDVEVANGGPEALNRLSERPDFVVLFTDLMMPEMDGIQLIREARKVAPGVIPIVMTGHGTLETARAAVKEGAYDYVLKPFSLSEIKLAVHNAIERHRLMRDNARLRDLTELFDISEKIATFHQEKPLLDFVLRAALERVGALRGSIMLTTQNGRALRMAASIGVPDDVDTEVDFGSTIAGRVAQTNLPLCVKDIRKNPELEELSQRLRDASFISVPLERCHGNGNGHHGLGRSEGPQVIAVLNVNQKKDGGEFTDGDLKALSVMAKHASIALANVHLLRDLENAHLDTLQSMAKILEAKDPYTHGHSERVRNYALMACSKLGMSDEDLRTMRLGAMLHDVGKIGVADSILNKIERLSDDEWQSIKAHPVIGFDILEPVKFLSEKHLALVRSHHERLDGSGYPDGLTGDDQNDLVRILAVSDTYDAMSSDRAYRAGLSPGEIIEELEYCSQSKLDPRIARLFIEMIKSGEIATYANGLPEHLLR